MADNFEEMNLGTEPNDGTGEGLRDALTKVQNNFTKAFNKLVDTLTLEKISDSGDAAGKDVGTGATDVAAGDAPANAITAHEASHPIPTTRDDRNEAAIAIKGSAFNKDFGTGAGDVCQGNDSRLSDSRTPTAHKSSHETGGSDALSPADIGAATSDHDHDSDYLGITAKAADSSKLDGRTPTQVSSDVRSDIEFGDLPTGTSSSQVAVGNHTHTQLHDRQHNLTSGDDHQMSTARIIGRTTASTGAPEELTAANVRSFISVEENASAHDGTKTVGVKTETGTSYTLVAADAGKYIRFNNANDITVTVPPNSSVAFDTGTVITGEQMGAGQVTFDEGSGVTINALEDGYSTADQYAAVQLVKVDTNTWTMIGGVE